MKKYYYMMLLLVLLLLTTGCKKGIVGKWKAIDVKDEYYYIFNNDKTCSYQMKFAKLSCTYEIDEENITILFIGNTKSNNYKYQLKDNSLIIKDESGKDNKFIKVKEINFDDKKKNAS